jgi:hypothetical protein
MSREKNHPIKDKEEIRNNPDPKIDQDFEGYPAGPARDETIKPKTKQDKKTADLDDYDDEKRIIRPEEPGEFDEQESDGSASAFEDK